MNIFVSEIINENASIGAYIILSPEELMIYRRFHTNELTSMLEKDIIFTENQKIIDIAIADAQTHSVTSVIDPRPTIYTDMNIDLNTDYRVVRIDQAPKYLEIFNVARNAIARKK